MALGLGTTRDFVSFSSWRQAQNCNVGCVEVKCDQLQEFIGPERDLAAR
jgi:hypothetical protein